jgi:hypothetical protein
MSHTLDAIVQLTVNSSTSHAHKRLKGQVGTLRQFRVTVGTLFVGRQPTQLSDEIIRRKSWRFASIAGISAIAVGGSRRSQHSVVVGIVVDLLLPSNAVSLTCKAIIESDDIQQKSREFMTTAVRFAQYICHALLCR